MAERLCGRRNGGREFRENVLPSLLDGGLRILDVGGGKRPQIDPEIKQRLGLYVVGLDIDADELRQAPKDAYDETVVGDVAEVPLTGEFDLIISKAVLEHTQHNPRVIRNLASALKAGGRMAHCIPCRNALFARVNMLLGNETARRILFALQPGKKNTSGFRAYYDCCTPSHMTRLCEENGLHVTGLSAHFSSDYCSFFAPLYTLDLLRQLLMRLVCSRDMAENFVLVAIKPQSAPGDEDTKHHAAERAELDSSTTVNESPTANTAPPVAY